MRARRRQRLWCSPRCYVRGELQRRKKPQQIRGLNRNHNHEMKEIFKGAATRASCGVGPLRDFYVALLAKGRRADFTRPVEPRVYRGGPRDCGYGFSPAYYLFTLCRRSDVFPCAADSPAVCCGTGSNAPSTGFQVKSTKDPFCGTKSSEIRNRACGECPSAG